MHGACVQLPCTNLDNDGYARGPHASGGGRQVSDVVHQDPEPLLRRQAGKDPHQGLASRAGFPCIHFQVGGHDQALTLHGHKVW